LCNEPTHLILINTFQAVQQFASSSPGVLAGWCIYGAESGEVFANEMTFLMLMVPLLFQTQTKSRSQILLYRIPRIINSFSFHGRCGYYSGLKSYPPFLTHEFWSRARCCSAWRRDSRTTRAACRAATLL